MPRRTPPGPLRLRRLTLGLTQGELALLSGVSREQIVRLEASTCNPTWRTVTRLASALSCSPAALFPSDTSSASATTEALHKTRTYLAPRDDAYPDPSSSSSSPSAT
jgi:transcriptional regulator with XRE-family HTH domain